MPNTFDGYQREFSNQGIHFLLAEIIKFRKQLTVRTEFKSQSGWDNGLNAYMIKELEKLGDTIENITYHPDSYTQEELEEQAADTTRSLEDDYNETALTSDNLLMFTRATRPVVWDLSGGDVDIPQMGTKACPNDAARAFITLLDTFFSEATRLDSRYQASSITKYESVMLRSVLNELYTLTQRKGGEQNKSDVPQGSLPSQEPGAVS